MEWPSDQALRFWKEFAVNYPKYWHWLTNPLVLLALLAASWHTIVQSMSVVLTGNKRADKVYHWHTGYPGGIKDRTAEKILDGKHPERVLQKAVERMIPRGPLGRQQLRNLRIYAGPEHPHEAQNPTKLDVAALNSKNARSA